MSVITGLRNTQKGQLQYSPHVNPAKLKFQLDQFSPPPLSHFQEEKESSKQNLSFGLDPASFPSSPNTSANFNENCSSRSEDICLSECGDHFLSKQSYLSASREEKSDAIKEDSLALIEALSPSGDFKFDKEKHLYSQISPDFSYTSCAIIDEDKRWEREAQLSLSKKHSEFENHHRTLDDLMGNKEKEMYSRLVQQDNHRQILIDKKRKEGMEETFKMWQKFKEDQEKRMKKLNSKQEEIEIKRELLKEEERKRREKMSRLYSLLKDIDTNLQTYIQQHDNFKYKSRLPELVDKYRAAMERVHSSFLAQVQAENLQNVDELIKKVEEEKHKSCQALSFLQKQIEETEEKIRAEEEEMKEREKEKAVAAADAKKQREALAEDTAVQSLAFILKEYETKSKYLAEVEAAIKPFVENVKNKTFRFSIQRAVNTPINAISDYSGPHLMDKLKKLKELFNGQIANLSGNSTPGSVPPDALLFCQNLVAKMLVKKGEEQVTSKHESAFPIGIVIVALWQEFPIIGDLFMAHLQAMCPYVLPMYFTRQKDQNSIDYHRSLGYKISEDGTIEEQDKFLRRMSGLMRLYCSCLVAPLPPGVNSPHPHGLDNAWKWLARTMNLEPQPDVTAAMIFDMLSVTGHALFKEYRVQFAKLLHLLSRSYLLKLENISVTNATVGRLKIFLETAMQNASIPPPEGLLSSNFFFKPADPVL